jgi:glycosyltransferase involved in cell wall biosynthesis
VTSPRISVFTPSHNTEYLDDAYTSLANQTFTDWEWVIVLNNGGALTGEQQETFAADSRVRVLDVGQHNAGVGHTKAIACREATAELLFELDHDDVLLPKALEKTVDAFDANPDALFVYSNTAHINADGSPNYQEWRKQNGWQYRTVILREPMIVSGTELTSVYECISFAATPHNVSLIWFAPNHLRAFTAAGYEEAGGYNAALIHNDDQDLISRLYQVGPFVHLNELLYLQRTHARNTQRVPQINADIQVLNWEFYERHLQANALAWANREGLPCVELGSGNAPTPGYTGIDLVAEGEGIIKHDLSTGIPFEDSSVAVIRCVDFLEHIADKQFMMDEIYRVLVPGGLLLSLTPSTDGRGAFQDPTHVSFWNENSFWYHTDQRYQHYSPQTSRGLAAFQVSRLRTFFPSEWYQQHNISYVQANLIAIKPGTPRNGGELLV